MISQERDRVSRQPDTVEIKLSDLKKELLDKAWYDYCITNRLIAYGEVPELTEEQIEAHCKEQYKKDCEKIRSRLCLRKKQKNMQTGMFQKALMN